jgi:nicotinamidase-related amidase
VNIRRIDTAIVFLDPQNDVLSDRRANWKALGASVTENRTVENMERIFNTAKANGYEVFISPHYFYPTDNAWKMNGPLEAEEFRTHTFARRGPLTLEGFPNSGADWLGSRQTVNRRWKDHCLQFAHPDSNDLCGRHWKPSSHMAATSRRGASSTVLELSHPGRIEHAGGIRF